MENVFSIFGVAIKAFSWLLGAFLVLAVAVALLNILTFGIIAHFLGI